MKLTVSCPPHSHCGRTTRGLMASWLLAMLPAAVMAALLYGLPAVRVMALSMAVAVAVEWLCCRAMKRPSSIGDGNALLIGLTFAFLVPVTAPWWLVTVGSATAVALGKMAFGGLGGNPLNPAVVGWAVCRVSWKGPMNPDFSVLQTALESPVSVFKYFGPRAAAEMDKLAMFFGDQLGGVADSQVAALLLGGALLLATGRLRPAIPLAYLAGLAGAAWVFQMALPGEAASPAFHLLAGGTVFAAFFLAPEWGSSPVSKRGMIVYGLFAGAMTVLIRQYGVYTQAAPFAVLLANLLTPLLDNLRPKAFARGGR
ncbi:RnfABCDGE type electron transport complex subunit D [Desulfohalovibrio reitneri]|uniref:RnfABCDGE type electron transport complex subunit D n=1 Tax=Desulfohalovibrio reitneri TaxID=1307759 RepID=UPI000AD4393D|nr:RnfABCDGE type electron transport complex subunit D [Desulfohalovibrio reitneri]